MDLTLCEPLHCAGIRGGAGRARCRRELAFAAAVVAAFHGRMSVRSSHAWMEVAMPHTSDKTTGGSLVRARPWHRQLYVQVLAAIVIGILLGWRWPDLGESMEPIGTTFVTALKMLIGPIVFLTIIGGIASVADLKKVGRTAVKALVYFQGGTIVAMAVGLVAINLFPLGKGVHADVSSLELSGSVGQYVEKGEHQHWWEFLTSIVPDSFFGAFVQGNILQVIFLAVIFGIALKMVGKAGEPIIASVNRLTQVVFKVLSFVMKAAPLGAFGAMAFAIGKFGLSTLTSLGSLILLFYVTSILFVVVALGAVMAAYVRLNMFQLLRFFKEELLLILGTSTAEPALPGLMRKLQFMGVDRSTVGLVVPTGYSFNLDGTAIYLSLATLYIAQATDTSLSVGQQLGLLAVMLLTSKGAAGVTGGGFIALTATLSTMGHVPVAGIMLVFGIDKFMSECRGWSTSAAMRSPPSSSPAGSARSMWNGPGRSWPAT
ncbi:cation:dicarboxylate symporter family transporter [Streptomyces sp. NRRL WC-3744]|uniref:cation:dicarboxylate symporter family transporter n=1 Tax=Streptomyces sp. NRRL WC-3744 TaxID=1463935 RepID=UPI002D21A511|nr:cation:dicarboxylase symporter family transporter [Streptomyces sp. NRRL WC-3744]